MLPATCSEDANNSNSRDAYNIRKVVSLGTPCENSRDANDKDKPHLSSIYFISTFCTVKKSSELRCTKYTVEDYRRTKYDIGGRWCVVLSFSGFLWPRLAVWNCLLPTLSLSKHTVRSGFIRLVLFQLPLFELPLSFFRE